MKNRADANCESWNEERGVFFHSTASRKVSSLCWPGVSIILFPNPRSTPQADKYHWNIQEHDERVNSLHVRNVKEYVEMYDRVFPPAKPVEEFAPTPPTPPAAPVPVSQEVITDLVRKEIETQMVKKILENGAGNVEGKEDDSAQGKKQDAVEEKKQDIVEEKKQDAVEEKKQVVEEKKLVAVEEKKQVAEGSEHETLVVGSSD